MDHRSALEVEHRSAVEVGMLAGVAGRLVSAERRSQEVVCRWLGKGSSIALEEAASLQDHN